MTFEEVRFFRSLNNDRDVVNPQNSNEEKDPLR